MKKAIVMLVVNVMIAAMAIVMVKPSEAGISCGQVGATLAPCLPYISGKSQDVTSCCQGVKKLVGMTRSKEDKQAACECVKAAAANYPNLKPDVAAGLPSKCGVPISIPISSTVNCKTIS